MMKEEEVELIRESKALVLHDVETKPYVPEQQTNGSISFLFTYKKNAVQVVIKADSDKMKQMTPFLKKCIDLHLKGNTVTDMQKYYHITNFKLLVGFSESGKIIFSNWQQLLKLVDSIGLKANKSLITECRRRLMKFLSLQNLWIIVKAIKNYSSYRILKCVIAKFLATKPDACIQCLDLSQLSTNHILAFVELGALQDDRSYLILNSALDAIENVSPGRKFIAHIDALRKRFLHAEKCKPASEIDQKLKKEPSLVECMDIDFLEETLCKMFIEKVTEKPVDVIHTPDVETLDLYQDVSVDKIYAVVKVPLIFSIKFNVETELSLVGFELLSRSSAPTKLAKRAQLDPEYQENLFLTVDTCNKAAEKCTALKKKLDGPSTRGDSKIICFNEDEVRLPKGFNCTIQLQVLDFCWYKALPKPVADKFISVNGQLLLKNVSFEVNGAVEEIPELCPISRIFVRPFSP